MPAAKVNKLKVRPLQSTDLCFEVDGVLGEQNALMPMLGLPVTKFDFGAFYAGLGVENNAGDPGRLKYDSAAMRSDPAIQASLLFALRAESTKAVLDKTIAARENTFYGKYKNQTAIIHRMQTDYDTNLANTAAKSGMLKALKDISQKQHADIQHEYNTDGNGMNVVVKRTFTNFGAKTTTVDPKGTSTSTQSLSNNNLGYDYRHPSQENEAQYQRAQASLLDEMFNQFMQGQNLPVLDRVFTNELRAIDLDVRRLQIAYLNTILLSPIDGVVTGLFKNLGDSVRAGEPVLRVENETEVLLVGTLIFRGMVSINSPVTVTTQIFGSPAPATVSGRVVAVRGHDSEEDEWDVLVRCPNRDATGAPILPINYNFDFAVSTATIN